MLFALGYVAGLVTAAFVATVLVLMRKPLYQIGTPIVKALENAGPRAEGFIYEPMSEADEARQAHIAANAEQGKDTPISELQ